MQRSSESSEEHGPQHPQQSKLRFQIRSSLRSLAVLVPLAAGLACGVAHAGQVLPAGGQFIASSGSISGGSKSLTINQTSTRGVIDWKSFSIGNGGKVTFDNRSGATRNRVTGHDPSYLHAKPANTNTPLTLRTTPA